VTWKVAVAVAATAPWIDPAARVAASSARRAHRGGRETSMSTVLRSFLQAQEIDFACGRAAFEPHLPPAPGFSRRRAEVSSLDRGAVA